MTATASAHTVPFVERRDPNAVTVPPPAVERRQFVNSHTDLSPDARELAMAVDQYKLHHRRRFITYEEVLHVVQQLGYRKSVDSAYTAD